MQIKKSLVRNNFFKLIIGEIYLLVSIIIIAVSISIYISIKQSSKIKEFNSKATIILPSTELFFIAQIAQDSSYLSGSSLLLDVGAEALRERFNIKFTSNLMSLSNLQNFLDLEDSSDYDQLFKKKNLNMKNYFRQNKITIAASPIDKNRKFVFILNLKHPLGLEGESLLKSYINYTKDNILNDYVKLRLDAANRVITSLKNNLEINKKYKSMDEYAEDNAAEFYRIFLEQSLNKKDLSTSEAMLFNYLQSNNNLLSNLSDISINKKIEILEFNKKNIGYFDYEPVLELTTVQYFENNQIHRNVVVVILISFVIFFSVIFFKQIYKDYLNK